jgi:pimeloyl-ACP methyl ester carboxylesterase
MPYLTVRDIDIFFDRAGAGAPLLAISGSRGDLRRKPNLLESPLAKSFDVLAYDQRGLGVRRSQARLIQSLIMQTTLRPCWTQSGGSAFESSAYRLAAWSRSNWYWGTQTD